MKILFCGVNFPTGPHRLVELLSEHEITTCSPDTVTRHLDAVDVVIPAMTSIDVNIIEYGQFGLIQQFGVGLDTVDIEAATRAGVWVARDNWHIG